MRKVLTIAFFIGLVSVSIAQKGRYNAIRNYSPADGLPQSQVNAMVEDSYGYLWIASEGGGLARFDGRKFKIFTALDGLLSNIICGLYIDSHQNLWILHYNGLTKYDGLRFIRFEVPDAGIKYRRQGRINELNDSLFVLTADGHVGKIYRDSVYYWAKPLMKDVRVRLFFKAPTGQLCYHLRDGRLFIVDNAERYFIKNINTSFFNVFKHGQETWFRNEKGTFRINFDTQEVQELPVKIENWVMSYDEKKNSFWTTNRISLFRETFKQDKLAKHEIILQDTEEVVQVISDSEGNWWFATNGAGIFKYFEQDFDRCGSDNLRGTMAILVDSDKAKWVGTMTRGLWKIHNGKITSYVDKKDRYRNSISCIIEGPDKTVWVASGHGVGKYNKANDKFIWYTSKEGLPKDYVLNMTFDSQGVLWLGTVSGVYSFDGRKFREFCEKQGLIGNSVSCIFYSEKYDAIYTGTESGIFEIKDNHVSKISIPELTSAKALTIRVYQDSLLLIGSAGSGVVMFNPETKRKKSITTRDGLPSDFIYFAGVDEVDNIWVGSEKGITRMRLNNKWEIVENLHYDNANGLAGVETNQNAFYLSKENKYFGLIDGLYEFNNIDQKGKKSFDLHLTDVEILYGEYSSRDYSDSLMGFFNIPHNPVLPPDKNHVTFAFNRVDKRYPKSVMFRYYLENFDKTWSQPSSMNWATYGNLPPGDYVFRVMATNSNGNWSEAKITYPFKVLMPFYQRASFIFGMLILLAAGVTLAIYIRIQQRVRKVIETERIRIREQEILRKEIARDFHDEMGNQLTRIINYISLMKMNGNGLNGHYDLYTKVEESAKYLYTGTRDFIWSIDPINDELTKLFIHIRDFGEKLFEEKGISFRAFNEVKERIKLPYGFSREANLIFKEAMTNSFKYSEAKNVSLTLTRSKEGLELCFEDDGVGFNLDAIEKSNGLKNIRERAEKIHTALRINTSAGRGTGVSLNFSLNKKLKYGATI